MKFSVLGSGSRGNCIAVWEDGAGLLIDLGLSWTVTQQRAAEVGLDLGTVKDALITHGHGDHVQCVRRAIEHGGMRIWAHPATLKAIEPLEMYPAQAKPLAFGEVAMIGDWEVYPTAAVHNSEGAMAFAIGSPRGATLSMYTETGKVTLPMFRAGRRSHIYVIEANHDRKLCSMNVERPQFINERTMITHLSNRVAMELLKDVDSTAQAVVFVHLSQDNNTPELVGKLAAEANQQRRRPVPHVYISSPDHPTPVVSIDL